MERETHFLQQLAISKGLPPPQAHSHPCAYRFPNELIGSHIQERKTDKREAPTATAAAERDLWNWSRESNEMNVTETLCPSMKMS